MRSLAAVLALSVVILTMVVPLADAADASIQVSTSDGRTYMLMASDADATWDLGDGSTAEGGVITHTFGSGQFLVSCTIDGTQTTRIIDVCDEGPIFDATVGTEYRCRIANAIDATVSGIDGADASWIAWDASTQALVGTPSETGSYSVRMEAMVNGRVSVTNYVITVSEASGDDGEDDQKVELSMSVSSDGLRIIATPSRDLNGQLVYWAVYDSTGRLAATTHTPTLDIEMTSAGLYSIYLTALGVTISQDHTLSLPEPTPEPVGDEGDGDLILWIAGIVAVVILLVMAGRIL